VRTVIASVGVSASHPSRAAMVDWADTTRRMVAEYRAAMAGHVAEPAWKCLVTRLAEASPEFVEIWDRHEMAGAGPITAG
jgi:hypothetical protein